MWLKPRLKKSSHAFLLHLALCYCHENMPRPACKRKDPFQFSQKKPSLFSPQPADMWTSLANLNNSALQRQSSHRCTSKHRLAPREQTRDDCRDSQTKSTGRPGVLWFMGSQRVGHDWATELNWTEQTKWFIYCCMMMMMLVAQSCPTLRPHELMPTRPLWPWDSPGKKTGVSSHSLLQGIFLTEGSNFDLLHYRQILYHLSHQGSPLLLLATCILWLLLNVTV